jgi:hypothetical protein
MSLVSREKIYKAYNVQRKLVADLTDWSAEGRRARTQVTDRRAELITSTPTLTWHLLSGDGRYRHVKVRSYATKLLNWGYKIGKEQRGQKCGAFVLYWLQQVGLDGQIDQLGTGKNICYLRV